jgi:hypothetical protein
MFAILLTLLFSYLPKSWIEIPLLVLIGLLQAILGTVPQIVVWAVLLALLLFIAILTIPQEKIHKGVDETSPRIYESRAAKWQRLIEQSSEGPYFQWRLSSALRDLVLEILSFSDKRPFDELRESLKKGEKILPDGYQEFIQNSLDERSLKPSEGTNRADRDLDLMKFIAYLEKRLEGRSDR